MKYSAQVQFNMQKKIIISSLLVLGFFSQGGKAEELVIEPNNYNLPSEVYNVDYKDIYDVQINVSDLPDTREVKESIYNNPNVLAAQEKLKQIEAQARRVALGNYEWSVYLSESRRHVKATGLYINEWEVGGNRSFRWPIKVKLDEQIAAQMIINAQFELRNTVHERSRLLLKLWFNYLRERAQFNQWQQQVEILAEQLRVSTRRIAENKTPKIEGLLSEGAYTQAQAQLAQAQLRVQNAQIDLTSEFPLITVPEEISFSDPKNLDQGVLYWVERMTKYSHELASARGELALNKILAKRADVERNPDPNIGFRQASEMANTEGVTGLTITLPIAGEGRKADAEAALFGYKVALQKETLTLKRIVGEAKSLYRTVQYSYDAWLRAKQAAKNVKNSADLLSQSYAKGHADLMDTLSARKQAIESALAAKLALIDAEENYYRLLLDAHILWNFDSTLVDPIH